MKFVQEILSGNGFTTEVIPVPHKVYLDDFSTSHPNSSRVDRIANEVNEYLRYKKKHAEG